MSDISSDVKFDNPIETDVRFLDPVEVRVDPVSGSVTSVGAVGPVKLDGIPSEYTIHTSIDSAPKLTIGVDPLHVALDSLPKITFGYDPIELRVTELPSIRAHLPADFSVGLSVLGVELLCVRLCGEAQVITEPYVRNPCERCGPVAHVVLVEPQDTITTAKS